MGKMNNKIGKMLSRESMPNVDERGMSSGMRSILSKQSGTSVFQKYASPLESYSSPAPVAVDNASAFTNALDAAKPDKKQNSKSKEKEKDEDEEKEDKPKNEKKETEQALVINVDKDGNEEEQDQTGLGITKMGDIYEPNMQDDVNISSSSVVQGQDGNPGDVKVEDNTLMKRSDDRYVSKKEFKNVIKEDTGMSVRKWRKNQKKHSKGTGSKNDPLRINL
jgi:hypothetical protein